MTTREREQCDRQIDRMGRRVDWPRIGAWVGIVGLGGAALYALVEVVVWLAFYLGGAL